jgi:hypothetical protein
MMAVALEGIWKAVIASFNVLSWHLPGGTEENQEKPHPR